jgi:hypothetical protein
MSDTNENQTAQLPSQLISALNDQALDAITGGFDRVTAENMTKIMFDSGQVKADIGINEDYARQVFALALQAVVFAPQPKPDA